jgi:hypothetical protein
MLLSGGVIRIRKPHELTDGFSRIVRAEARSIRNHLENLAFTEAASGTPYVKALIAEVHDTDDGVTQCEKVEDNPGLKIPTGAARFL